MAFLRTIWDSVRSLNHSKESVDLNPVEQIALRYLLHYGPHAADEVRQKVGGERLLIDTEFEDALTHLVDTGLVEVTPQIAGKSALTYAPTRKSGILKDRIPQDPRGVTEFYL